MLMAVLCVNCPLGWLQSEGVQEVSAADLQAAEPDVLRAAAPELVRHWNE